MMAGRHDMNNQTHYPDTVRVIDANLNRTSEALRVIEDCLRFVLEDRYLTQLCKHLRHDLTQWAHSLEISKLISARDSRRDVGRDDSFEHEYHRDSVEDILNANFARAEQSLRCLEEFSKLIDSGASKTIERIRYETYALEKSVMVTFFSRERLSGVRLYALLDGRKDTSTFLSLVDQLINGGAHAIQLRDKKLNDRELLSRANEMVRRCRSCSVISVVNDRTDIAVAAHADGVHLGQSDISVSYARKLMGPHRIIGVSTHDIQQARQAVLDGANYIGVGPTFESKTKTFDTLTGVEFLNKVAGEITLPAFAIGGIDLENLDSVLASGIERVAVGNALLSDEAAVAQRASSFVVRVDRAHSSSKTSQLTNPRSPRATAYEQQR